MTPLQIEMLIHFHAKASPWPDEKAPACAEALEYFSREKLVAINWNHDRWELTDRGRAYIHFLCSLPLPIASWAVPGPLNMTLSEGALL